MKDVRQIDRIKCSTNWPSKVFDELFE
jgi:hypothetical protein